MRPSRIQVAAVLLLLLVVAFVRPPGGAAAGPDDQKKVLQELFTLNRTLEETRLAMAKLDQRAAEVESQQADAQVAKEQLEVRRRQRQAAFGVRLRYYHEHGSVAPLGALLGAETLSDFLFRLDTINQILRRDASLLRELRALRDDVQKQEQALKDARAELTSLREQLAAEEQKLRAEIAKRETILEGLAPQDRPVIEAALDAVERDWNETAVPVLVALGESLRRIDPAEFQPDDVKISFFPPGATAQISEQNLNSFLTRANALKGISLHLSDGEMELTGQFETAPIRISGRIRLNGPTALRFEPDEIVVRDFTVPADVVARINEVENLDIEVGAMIKPFVLKDVKVAEGKMTLRAGLK